ncbi:MAG: hypothetical protein WBL61_07835 [Bryobacteraceae bacterium]
MPVECDTVSIDFKPGRSKAYIVFGPESDDAPGSSYQFDYQPGSLYAQYAGKIDPVVGPDCRFTPASVVCYAAPTGVGGPEGSGTGAFSAPYDHVVIRPTKDSFIYLDVGFWGGTQRDFALVCGPVVWLCEWKKGDAPAPADFYSQNLVNFRKAIWEFNVVSYTRATHPDGSTGDLSNLDIWLLLPDTHMWPDTAELCRRRNEFLGSAPSKEARDQAEQHLATPAAISTEENTNAFGEAGGRSLERMLRHVQKAMGSSYNVRIVQVGDLFEMWSPISWLIDDEPLLRNQWLQLSDVARERIPKWLGMVYRNPHNKASLDLMLDPKMGTRYLYGNHDVYMATGEWASTGIDCIDKLKGSRAWTIVGTPPIWLEHGHRFQGPNNDGSAFGPFVNTMVNVKPELRKLTGTFDKPEKNCWGSYVPKASLWFLLANHASLKSEPGQPQFTMPDRFRIFCQGHSHHPVLAKVVVSWPRK